MKKSTLRYLSILFLSPVAYFAIWFGFLSLIRHSPDPSMQGLFVGAVGWSTAALCAFVAWEKGRSRLGWGAAGLLSAALSASLIVVLLLAVLPHTKVRKSRLDGTGEGRLSPDYS